MTTMCDPPIHPDHYRAPLSLPQSWPSLDGRRARLPPSGSACPLLPEPATRSALAMRPNSQSGTPVAVGMVRCWRKREEHWGGGGAVLRM